MKDAASCIFRALERDRLHSGFDTIVTAAAAAYAFLRSPNKAQAADLGRLVMASWDRTSPEARQLLAATLSRSPRLPREIVDALLACPIDISEPFLANSPVLMPGDLSALSARGDQRIASVLAKRSDLATSTAPGGEPARVATSPEPKAQEAVQPVPRTRQARPEAKRGGMSPADIDPRAKSVRPATDAEQVRGTLARLVGKGAQAGLGEQRLTVETMLDLAMDGQIDTFYARLARTLGLSASHADLLRSDEDGERLAVALRALQVASGDAMSLLMMLKPEIGRKVKAFDRMERFYRALRPEDCRRLLGTPVRPLLKLQPLSQDIDRPERQEARPAFGRRKSRPLATSRRA
ncbi:DUF2336 domain-containing protein [Consotaella aegiceratis]|uniref:DUF2336 domain-containing protein n=1 Tax=Consotaella aegiceratis TaxID=3097961 RepID=UPI002F426265